MKFYASCPYGLNQILKKEIWQQGYKTSDSIPTGVYFEGDEKAIAKINLWSRTANKVYIILGNGKTNIFEDLFQIVNKVDWKKYINKGDQIIVNAFSKKSKLNSIPTIQSIGKKAIIKKILNNKDGFVEEYENNPKIEITIMIENDNCHILLNSSGDGLHKRGYRIKQGEAPLKENIAAGIILSSGWKFSDNFYDIFGGSGTFVIEAYMLAKNIAPGLYRNFSFENYGWLNKNLLYEEKKLAQNKIYKDKTHTIIYSDIDEEMVNIAWYNAKVLGIQENIAFENNNFEYYINKSISGHLVSNPPYNKRLKTENINKMYSDIKKIFIKHNLTGGVISSYKEFSDKNTFSEKKIYNGKDEIIFYKKI